MIRPLVHVLYVPLDQTTLYDGQIFPPFCCKKILISAMSASTFDGLAAMHDLQKNAEDGQQTILSKWITYKPLTCRGLTLSVFGHKRQSSSCSNTHMYVSKMLTLIIQRMIITLLCLPLK